MVLSFALLDSETENSSFSEILSSEAIKKVFGGLQTCQTLISIHQDIVELLDDFTHRVDQVDQRLETCLSPSILSTHGEMEGFIRVFSNFKDLFRVWSTSCKELSSTLQNKSINSMQHSIKKLNTSKEVFLLYKNVQNHNNEALVSNMVNTTHRSGDEYKLKSTKGSPVKVLSGSALVVTTKETSLRTRDQPPCVTKYQIKKNCFYMLDAWEKKRLDSLKKMLDLSLKGWLKLHVNMNVWVKKVDDSLSRFSCDEDMQRWMRSLLEERKLLLLLEGTTQLPSNKGLIDKSLIDKSLIEKKSGGQGSSIKDHGMEDNRRGRVQLNSGMLTEAQLQGGEPGELYKGDSLDVVQRCLSSRPMSYLSAPQYGGSGDGENVLTHQDSQLSVVSRSPLVEKEPSVDSESDENHNARYLLSSPQNIDDLSIEIDPTAQLPNNPLVFLDLFTHLSSPQKQYSKAALAERYIEIQRRFEEYLISLRCMEKKDNRKRAPWDDPSFYFDCRPNEFSFLYPFKLPALTASDKLNQHHMMALEWGSPQMDDFQWGCVAYETLLLVHCYMWYMVCLPESTMSAILTINNFKRPVEATPKKAGFTRLHESYKLVNAQTKDASFEKDEFEEFMNRRLLHDNLEIVCKLLIIMRLKLGITGEVNSTITNFIYRGTLPCSLGYHTSIHPLDIRYRLVRLIESWRSLEYRLTTVDDACKDTFYQCLKRQVHVVYTAILFKLWRLLRFIAKERNAFTRLNRPPGKGSPFSLDSKDLSLLCLDPSIPGYPLLQKLAEAFAAAYTIIGDLIVVLDKRRWGVGGTVGTTGEFRRCNIHGLLRLMNRIAFLDRRFRYQLIKDEIHLGEGCFKKYTLNMSQNKKEKNEKPLSLWEKTMVFNFSHLHLSVYWRYEPALVHLLMSYLWCSTTDNTSPDFLRVESHRLALGLLVVARVIEQGNARTELCNHDDVSCFATLSLQTHCLMLVSALWKEMILHSSMHIEGQEEEENDVSGNTSTQRMVLYEEPLNTMLRLSNVNSFIVWLFTDVRSQTSPPTHTTFKEPNATDIAFLAETSFDIPSPILQVEKCSRVLVRSIPYPRFALTFERSLDSLWCLVDGPDFGVLDVSRLNFLSNDANTNEAYQLIERLLFDANKTITQVQLDSISKRGPMRDKLRIPVDNMSLKLVTLMKTADDLLHQIKMVPKQQKRKKKLSSYMDDIQFESSDEIQNELKENETLYVKGGGGILPPTSCVSDAFRRLDKMERSDNKDVFHIECRTIRTVPEGISLLLPSRVERVSTEVLYNELFTSTLRFGITTVLKNYHFQLQPATLSILLNTWSNINYALLEKEDVVRASVMDMASLHMSNALSDSLQGPTSHEDFYRFFIYQTIFHLASRSFKKSRTALFMPPPFNDEEREKIHIQEMFKGHAVSLDNLVNEIRGEFLFYSEPWCHFLPNNQHAFIVVYATKKVLLEYFKELIDSVYWTKDKFPPYVFSLFQGIEKLERLFRDVMMELEVGGRWRLSLFEPFMFCLQPCLLNYYEELKTLIVRCLDTETWKPLSKQMHCSSVMYFFTFTYPFLTSLFESGIPLTCFVPSFLTFFKELVSLFCKSVLLELRKNLFVEFLNEIDLVFLTLRAPAEGGCNYPQAGTSKPYELSKRLPKQLHKSNILRAMRKIGDVKHMKGFKGKNIKNLPYKLWKPAEDTVDPNDSVSCADSVSDSNDDPGKLDGNHIDGKSKNLKKHNKISGIVKGGDPIDGVSEHTLLRIQQRYGDTLALRYFNIQSYFANCPLKSCLVRFHTLQRFLEELMVFHNTFLQGIKKKIGERDPEFKNIVEALAASRGDMKYEIHWGNTIPLDGYDSQVLEELTHLVSSYYDIYIAQVERAKEELYRLTALRIVTCEFGEDFFCSLYYPEFKDMSFRCILGGIGETVEWFISKLPSLYQLPFRTVLVQIFVKMWCFLLSKMGFNGTIFLPEDLIALREDLLALKAFIDRTPGLPSPLLVIVYTTPTATSEEQVPEKLSLNIPLVKYVEDFLNWLEQHPRVLAELHANDFVVDMNATHVKDTSPRSLSPVGDLLSLSSENIQASDDPSQIKKDPTVSKKKTPMKKNRAWIPGFF